jgi:hypothetical protein
MAHEITLTIPTPINIQNTDLTLEVNSDGIKLGELRISKGSVDWWPNNHRTNCHRVTWERLKQLLEGEPLTRAS